MVLLKDGTADKRFYILLIVCCHAGYGIEYGRSQCYDSGEILYTRKNA